MTSKFDIALDFRTPTNFFIQVYTLKIIKLQLYKHVAIKKA